MRTLNFAKPQGAPVRYPPAPDGFTIYLVGDIHGRLDLLLDVQRRIDEDKTRCVRGRVVEVYLGDYIDRGADPAGVISRLIDRAREVHAEFLRGNHEQLLLDFLDGKDCLDQWLVVGGIATLLSYGLASGPTSLAGAAARRKLRQAMPPQHRQFYEKTRSYIRLGRYLAVHAGLRPGVALEKQKSSDLLGIRQTFLEFDGDFGFVVVHGHTPVTAPELLPNRINIDTGAFATNRLTCLKIDAGGARVLQDKGVEGHFSGAAPDQAPLIEMNMIKADIGDQASVRKGDPYSILGVRRGASSREARAAYLRQVKALHPDGGVDDPITAERLKIINAAFQELKRVRQRPSPTKAERRSSALRTSTFFGIGFLTSSVSVLLIVFAYYMGFLIPQDGKLSVAAKPESVVTGLTTISQTPTGTQEEREIAWTEAERTGSREAWQRFIEAYPDGDRAAKAKQALADIDAAEAPQRADRAALAEAEKSEGKPALRWYLPNWAEAERRLVLLEEEKGAEDVAWSKALLENSRVSYAAYLGAYPTGRRAADARARIAELERLEAKR